MRLPSALQRFLPSHTSDPIGTLTRVLKSRNAAGRAAVRRTALGAVLTPFDWLLTAAEASAYGKHAEPQLPTLFVCGPARSGTSVTAQVIIRQFPVAYFSNVVELFPRAPLTASRLFARPEDRQRMRLSSFYGKTERLYEPSDAMAIWDRWFGADRDSVPQGLATDARDAMRRFFAAWESAWHRPVAAKYNRLYLCAELIAEALPRAHFLCLERDAVYLAQSQLIARRVIVGNEHRPYGTVTPEYRKLMRPDSPIEDACAYVAADRQVVARTRQRVGPERFWVMSYEQFCRDPEILLQRLSREVLDLPYEPIPASDRAAIRVSASQSVDDATFRALTAGCERLGLQRPGARYFTDDA